jgi:SAM-dependent methyltransferase
MKGGMKGEGTPFDFAQGRPLVLPGLLLRNAARGIIWFSTLQVDNNMGDEPRQYYDELWSRSKVVDPSVWAMWDTISTYLAGKTDFLEIGAGNRPRIPITGSYFVDLSAKAMEALREKDGRCTVGCAEALPFPDAQFDLICAFEIVEHVPNDKAVLKEISRVLKQQERFIFSVPLHMEYWSRHDELAGHMRRYDPAALESLLREYELVIERYNVTFSPRNPCYRNITAYLATRFWQLGVALEGGLALPVYTWLDRRRGIKWKEGNFVEGTRRANNVIIVCRREKN